MASLDNIKTGDRPPIGPAKSKISPDAKDAGIAAKTSAEDLVTTIVQKYIQNNEYYFLDRPRGFLQRVFENFYEEVSEQLLASRIAQAENVHYDIVPRIVTQLKIACLKTQHDIATNPHYVVFADGLREVRTFANVSEKGLLYVNRLAARYETESTLEATIQRFLALIFGTTKTGAEFSAGFLEVLAQIFFAPRPLRHLLYVFGNGPGIMQLIDFVSTAGGTYCEKQDIAALQRITYLPDYTRLRLRDVRLFLVSFVPNGQLANPEVLKRFIGDRHHSSDLFQSRMELKQRFTLLLYSNKQQFFAPDPEYWNHLLPFRIGEVKRLTPTQYAQHSQEIESLFQQINNQDGYDALFVILRRIFTDQLKNGFNIRECILKLCRVLGGIKPELDDFWVECSDIEMLAEFKTRHFYKAYLEWCRLNDVRRPLSIREFSIESVEKGFVGKKRSNGAYLTGRRLKAEFDPELKEPVNKLKRAQRGNRRRKSS